MSEKMVKIALPLSDDDRELFGFSVETVWASVDETARDRFVLENIPFAVQGFGYLDRVTCVEREGMRCVADVVERSGYSTIHVVILQDAALSVLKESLREYGCEWEGGHGGLYAVAVPPGTGFEDVSKLMAALQDDGMISYRIAHRSDHHLHGADQVNAGG